MAANDKERIASEEAEKRLKAALTAKRDPSTTTPRIGSPAVGDSTTPADQSQGQAAQAGEDVVMNGAEPPQPMPQVRTSRYFLRCSLIAYRTPGNLSCMNASKKSKLSRLHLLWIPLGKYFDSVLSKLLSTSVDLGFT